MPISSLNKRTSINASAPPRGWRPSENSSFPRGGCPDMTGGAVLSPLTRPQRWNRRANGPFSDFALTGTHRLRRPCPREHELCARRHRRLHHRSFRWHGGLQFCLRDRRSPHGHQPCDSRGRPSFQHPPSDPDLSNPGMDPSSVRPPPSHLGNRPNSLEQTTRGNGRLPVSGGRVSGGSPCELPRALGLDSSFRQEILPMEKIEEEFSLQGLSRNAPSIPGKSWSG